MPSSDRRSYVEDILDHIEKIRAFTSGMNLEQFLADERTFYAVVRALEIISEASRRVEDEVQERHPEIPWRDIAAAGNLYRHTYLAVDEKRVWKTITWDLDVLETALRDEL